jgi:hypothetical protein
MKMWNLDQSAIKALNALPETGVGFQIVEAQIWGTPTPLLVLGGQQAIDLSKAELIPGDDPATVLRNGLRVIAALQGDMAITMIAAPGPRSFRVLQTRIGPLASGGAPAASSGVVAALPSSLVKHDTLKANRIFYRYSALQPGQTRRPEDGQLKSRRGLSFLT